MTQASQMIASQYRNGEYNRRIWAGIVYNVKDYGAKGDGITDDTQAIQKLIDGLDHGRIFFPAGEYYLTRQGTRLLDYSGEYRGVSLVLEEKTNLSLWFEPGARIKVNMSDDVVSCGFWVSECTDLLFEDTEFIGIGTPANRLLEEGIGISIDHSKRIQVLRPRSTDMRGCARAYNSSNIRISDGFSTVSQSSKATGHFALYQSVDSEISNCTTYGSTLDGDTFIYGADSTNCNIVNSRSHAYAYGDATKTPFENTAQGIMVDSGGRNCKILDCYAYGYYYGLAVKNGSEGGVIQGCTAESCKVGVSAQQGEGTAPNNFVSILDNTIIPNGGNGNNSPLIGPIGDPIAIMVIDAYGGATIDNNSIYNSIDTEEQLDFYGIIAGISVNALDSSMGTLVISNNSISLENRNGTLFGSSRKNAILVTTQYRMVNVSITGNAFDLPQSGMTTNLIEAVNVFGLNITDNIFGVLATAGLPLIKLSGCVRAQVNGNGIGPHFGILQASACVGLSFNNNVVGESNAGIGVPTLDFSNCSYLTINSNVQIVELGLGQDGEFFSAHDGSNWITAQGNMLKIANKDSTNWYSTTATNFNIINNVVD